MSIASLFYLVKPMIPRRVQIAMRRAVGQAKVRIHKNVWPIDPQAAQPPEGWTGWPEKRRFALVLSHDVDTARGHERCFELMKAEEALGFRSCFNFVPEGYTVSPELRRELTEKGFDVGVHGLVHDSKLFSSRKIFEERALRINHYLKEWGAAGFHSPATLRNLDWIGELDIEYDGSTFDTDPFEPQPDGVRTIFPFVVCRRSSQLSALSSQLLTTTDRRINQTPAINSSASQPSGFPGRHSDGGQASERRSYYVELPYTLPQDHCVFVILKEKDIRIWKEKLDWIAERGGMALLNSHPDYINFRGGECALEEYDASKYMDFLQYVKSKYTGQYWHTLPREMARFWKKAMIK
ncbi:MAG: hypothetical protein H6Q41_1207 [Deltaproteobacteria bacterium]|nr:hypothetical protein [Deltaproteobacteria bacterium]